LLKNKNSPKQIGLLSLQRQAVPRRQPACPGETMQILLPIAGMGTRVRPHTHVRPKPMLQLAGKPVIGHLLDYLMPMQPSNVIFIVGERGSLVEAYVRRNYDVPVHFRTQSELKGQSHAVAMAADLITEPVLIIFGDTLFAAPCDELLDLSVDGTIAVHPVDNPARFGVVELKDGLITRLVEKAADPPSNLATIGVYMVNDHRGLLAAIDEQMRAGDALKGEFFLADALQRMVDKGSRLATVAATGWWDTGTIDAVLDTHRHLVEINRTRRERTPDTAVIEPCYIDATARLERCVVGPYVTVGAQTEIRDSVIGDAIIGDGVSIGGQVIRHSIIGNEAILRAAPLAYNISDHAMVRAARSEEPAS